MERIVLGISSINFNSSSEFSTEKSINTDTFNWANATFPCTMATAETVESSSAEGESSDQFDWKESTPNQRCLRARMAKSKENSLLRIKRRSIAKPRRNLSASMGEISMRPSAIKKLYLENKIKGNFRPANLETIFEEPTPDKNEQLCFVGAKKIKRSLSCSDGLNVTKTTVKSRRMKIKKTFGRRFALKKISLEAFIDRLNASFEERPTGSESVLPTEEEAAKTEDEDVTGGDMECADDTLPPTSC